MELVYPQIVTGADLLRGINKLNYVAPLLSRRGAIAASIVNSNMLGVPSFYKTMKKYNIQPVIGLTVRLVIGENEPVLTYIYAQTEEGYRNLLKMSSAISTTSEEALPVQWLRAYGAGCLVICAMTDATWDGLRQEEVLQEICQYQAKESMYMGVSRPGGIQHVDEPLIEAIAASVTIPIVAMYESRYVFSEDVDAFKTAQAIRLNKRLGAESDEAFSHQHAYLPEQKELEEWFGNRLEWLENVAEMLLSCRVKLQRGPFLMPTFPLSEGLDRRQYLQEKCEVGLRQRLGTIQETYQERLQYELAIIDQMGFTDYFLIVEDFIRFASSVHILTGPGRGSSAGSLVAYALGITEVDPLQYGLIFERFLNPERMTMPDIDIDFADNRRHEVIAYVAEKYGKTHVAQISTFGTLSARAVSREVARAFDFSPEEIRYLSSLIPSRPRLTLAQVYEGSNAMQEWVQMKPIRQQWFQSALLLEGLPRNASTHAAGIILSPKPLVNIVPLREEAEDELYLTQWSMGDVEEQGLLKIDFLGLRNLTLLDRIRTMIRYDRGMDLNFEQIPLDDANTYRLFQTGDMTGVFQFDSSGMRDTLVLIQPNRFEDLFAINALYRPGPMDYIPSYARRKKGQEQIHYLHPSLEPILKETYGIIVYQEQILQVFAQIGRYTMGEADVVRRAISNKNEGVLNKERVKFIGRAVENGIPQQTATDIYALILKFANYGFPKSHAVAYSLISYRLAYLKANEPAYFYAALLASLAGNHEKISEVISEATARGLKFLPPSIHHSKYRFTVEKGAIRIGLSSIQGITPKFYARLKQVRSPEARWKTMFDCAAAIGKEYFTEAVATQLIKAGAFDTFNESRGVLLASIDAALSHVTFIGADDQDDSFSALMQSIASPKYSPGEPIPLMKTLAYEREALGFYLSEYPTTQLKKTMNEPVFHIGEVDQLKEKSNVLLVGLIVEIKKIRTKKGEAMGFVKIQDETAAISCTFFPRQFTQYEAELSEMTIVAIKGRVERRQGATQVIVQTMKKVEESSNL